MSADSSDSSTALPEAWECCDVSGKKECPRVWGDAGNTALNGDTVWTFVSH